jgi:hypothetical protein
MPCLGLPSEGERKALFGLAEREGRIMTISVVLWRESEALFSSCQEGE